MRIFGVGKVLARRSSSVLSTNFHNMPCMVFLPQVMSSVQGKVVLCKIPGHVGLESNEQPESSKKCGAVDDVELAIEDGRCRLRGWEVLVARGQETST